jgi:hypothetical protein
MRAVRTALFVTTITGIALLIQAAGAAHDLADPLVVTGVALVSSEADGDFVTETYRATLHHSGPPGTRDFARVSATLAGASGLSVPGFIQIVDGDIAFGTIRAGDTVDSLDTFAVKRHRRIPLNPRRLRWQIAAHPDLVLPDAWTGSWRFRITRTDPTTQQLESTATITDTLGRREPVGFSLLPEFMRCRWHGDAESLNATCDGSARIGWCLTSGSAAFGLDRDGDTAHGEGHVRLLHRGECGNNAPEATDAIDIAGTRLSSDAADESLSIGLLPTFSLTPYFSLLLSNGVLAATQEEPSTDEDCSHGGWRRFRHPWFTGESACATYSRARARDHHDLKGGVR